MNKFMTGFSVLLILAGCNGEQETSAPSADIEAGKGFVKAHCTGCHTLDGRGKTGEIPNLAGQPAGYLVEAMNAYRNGTRKHSALRGLISGTSEADVRNIAAYFASLPGVQPALAEAAPSEIYSEGSRVAEVCSSCHGDTGFSESPGIPNLAGQHPMYLMVATQEYANGTRDNAEKEEMLRGLGDVDIEKMAIYFAAQAPGRRTAPSFGDVTAGEAQTAVCGACHGSHGIGDDPMVPNLAGQEPHYLVKAIKAYRDQSRSHEEMVAHKSDQEIEDIAAYYSVQQAGSIIVSGGQVEAIVAKCDRCHGPAMGESSMVVPSLWGQNPEYLLRVMKEYRDDERGNSMMHKMSASYNDQVLGELANYFATHPE